MGRPRLFLAILALAWVAVAVAAPAAKPATSRKTEEVPSANRRAGIAEKVFAHKSGWYGPLSKTWKPDVVVAQDGSGKFKSIQKAIDSVRPLVRRPNKKNVLIYVKKGLYFEEVFIPQAKSGITLVGDPGETRVRFNKYSAKLDKNGNPLGTANTGTLAVLADDFTMVNMIVENASPRPPPATTGYQAVAFRSAGNRTIVFNSSFYSYQDTLYAHKGYQYYKNCFIFGEVDFVFGAAKAIFDSSTFYMDSMGYAAVTANYRMSKREDSCFVIMNSHITGRNQGWLGRSWGKYACTVVANTYMDKAVRPDGWNDFGVIARQVNSFFAEYNNRGIGANLDGRVWWQKVIEPAQVKKYVTTEYIGLSSWIRALPIAPKRKGGSSGSSKKSAKGGKGGKGQANSVGQKKVVASGGGKAKAQNPAAKGRVPPKARHPAPKKPQQPAQKKPQTKRATTQEVVTEGQLVGAVADVAPALTAVVATPLPTVAVVAEQRYSVCQTKQPDLATRDTICTRCCMMRVPVPEQRACMDACIGI
ncbi:hypothetical protein CLOM_g21370 [Closterium sp. NIES-68]|nr:hypothetical protein CLOM_g21370 [Closterium sp. NIES-68]GJP75345.1 hypothetical protein CLOP_g5793 [Closterium sp. NIES-67]